MARKKKTLPEPAKTEKQPQDLLVRLRGRKPRRQRVGPPQKPGVTPPEPPVPPVDACTVRANAFFGADGAGVVYADLDQFVPTTVGVDLALDNPTASDRAETWSLTVDLAGTDCFISTQELNPGPNVVQFAFAQTLSDGGVITLSAAFDNPVQPNSIVIGATRAAIDGNALNAVSLVGTVTSTSAANTNTVRDASGTVNEQINQFIAVAGVQDETEFTATWRNEPEDPLGTFGDFRWCWIAEVHDAKSSIAFSGSAAVVADIPSPGTDNLTTALVAAPEALSVLIVGIGDFEQGEGDSAPLPGTGFTGFLNFVDYGFGGHFAVAETRNVLANGSYSAVFSATNAGTNFALTWVVQ